MESNFNDMLINILKILMPTGTIIVLLKSCVDIIASTSVEFSIENNYKRALRELITLLKWLILTGIVIIYFIFMWVTLTDTNNDIDVITSGQFMMNKSEYLKLQKKETLFYTSLILFALGGMFLIIYVEIRKNWYIKYRRKTYFWDKDKKYYLLKKIDKDYILCVRPKDMVNKILSYDKLGEKEIYTETVSERKKDVLTFILLIKIFLILVNTLY